MTGHEMPDLTETKSVGNRVFGEVNNIESLARWWPPNHHMPTLLLEVAALTSTMVREPLMTTGFWGIAGSHVTDYYVLNGADLSDQFGLFLTSYDGDYAIWYHEGATPGAEPVVQLTDGSAVQVVAPNIHAFFRQFGSGRGISGLTAFEDASLCGEVTPEQIAQRYADGAKIMALVDAAPGLPPGAPVPDLRAFLEVFLATQERVHRTNKTLQAIALLMKGHVPRSAEDFVGFRIVADGETMEVTTWLIEPELTTWAPLPERAELIPLLVQARNERAKGPTGAFGPWREAWLRIYHDGDVSLKGIWDIRDKT